LRHQLRRPPRERWSDVSRVQLVKQRRERRVIGGRRGTNCCPHAASTADPTRAFLLARAIPTAPHGALHLVPRLAALQIAPLLLQLRLETIVPLTVVGVVPACTDAEAERLLDGVVDVLIHVDALTAAGQVRLGLFPVA